MTKQILSISGRALAVATFAGATLLTGCGMGLIDHSEVIASAPLPALKGSTFGGATPIKHARVYLFASGSTINPTGTDTYGAGHLLVEANPIYDANGIYQGDTDANGAFSFNKGGGTFSTGASNYTCTPYQNLYVVSSGGNTADNDAAASFNPNALLVAALGPCNSISSTSFIYLNELTTVAAGYALGHFTTVTTDPGSTVIPLARNSDNSLAPNYNNGTYATPWIVGIGAPITNAAPYGCLNAANCDSGYEALISAYNNVSSPKVSTAPLAAGLTHAFYNANTIAPYSLNQGASLYPARNKAFATVPNALVNTIADILASCVNTAYSGNSTSCNTLYQATGLETTAGTVLAGANTLQAMINLAANPNLQNGVSNTSLFNTVGQFNGFFVPYLTGAPSQDWSIAINYPKGMTAPGSTLAMTYTWSVGNDINDVAYVANQSGNQTKPSNLIAIGADGTALSASASDANYIYEGITVDQYNNVYVGNQSVGSTAGAVGVLKFASSNGIVANTAVAYNTGTNIFGSGNNPYSVAADRSGNVWVGTSTSTKDTTQSDVYELPTPGTLSNTATFINPIANFATRAYGINVDPYQNIWIQNYYNGGADVIQNTGTVANPAYAAGGAAPNGLTTTSTGVASYTGPSAATAGYNTYFVAKASAAEPFDAYTGYYATGFGTVKYAGTVNSNAAIQGGTGSAYLVSYTSSTLENGSADGDGTLFVADIAGGSTTTANVAMQNTISGTTALLRPCLPASQTANTTCSNILKAARSTSVDAAGSVYVTGSTGGNIVEIIGVAAPTWPQLSLGLLGRP